MDKLIFAVSLLLIPAEALAGGGSCFERADIKGVLAPLRPVEMGISNRGWLVELWAGNDGNFAVVLTPPGKGVSCITDSGHSFTGMRPPEGILQ